MLLGTMVDNLVVGGPAFNSRQLHHGDVIVKVDGTPVTQSNIHEMMVGNDIPGTPVLVTITRGGPKVTAARRRSARRPHHRLNRHPSNPRTRQGPTVDVRMTRMATEEIYDRRRVFELFTALKVAPVRPAREVPPPPPPVLRMISSRRAPSPTQAPTFPGRARTRRARF